MQGSHRTWCFTLNNPTQEETDILVLDQGITYGVIGKEKGESGTPHLQGCLTFERTHRLSCLKKLSPRAHWEPCRNKEASHTYCKKEGDFIIIDNKKKADETENQYLIRICDLLSNATKFRVGFQPSTSPESYTPTLDPEDPDYLLCCVCESNSLCSLGLN